MDGQRIRLKPLLQQSEGEKKKNPKKKVEKKVLDNLKRKFVEMN